MLCGGVTVLCAEPTISRPGLSRDSTCAMRIRQKMKTSKRTNVILYVRLHMRQNGRLNSGFYGPIRIPQSRTPDKIR